MTKMLTNRRFRDRTATECEGHGGGFGGCCFQLPWRFWNKKVVFLIFLFCLSHHLKSETLQSFLTDTAKISKSLKAESLKWSLNITLSILPFLSKHPNTGQRAPVAARGNYSEKDAVLQVEGGMLITLVHSQHAAPSFSFVLSLYGLINYETMHRWFIWEHKMFKPCIFLSRVETSEVEPLFVSKSWRVLMENLNSRTLRTLKDTTAVLKWCKPNRQIHIFTFI